MTTPGPSTSQELGERARREAFHVAIIMDGNGRWALRQGLSRAQGHRAGADAVREVIETAPTLEIDLMTLYAFSSDNWKRPRSEVSHLMRLFRTYLDSECRRCREAGVRVSVIGRRDRLPLPLLRQVESTEARTRSGTKLHLRIAIDYSARDALLMAAVLLREAETPSRETFRRALAKVMNSTPDAPDVDLLIRTGGNQRLSDFLLWESAYAELLFTECLWPDFGEPELRGAVEEFFTRDRRFGRLSGSVGPRHSSPSVAEAGS